MSNGLELSQMFWGVGRKDGERQHLCECGCGFPTRNGWKYLKNHEAFMSLSPDDRKKSIEAELCKEIVSVARRIADDIEGIRKQAPYLEKIMSRLEMLKKGETN